MRPRILSLRPATAKTYKLSDLKGKAVVIACFPKALHRRLHRRVQVDEGQRRGDPQVRRGLLRGQL